jgi:MFS family permease
VTRETLEPTVRRQRLAIGGCFLATGAIYGTFAARIPAIQDRLELTSGELAVVFAGVMTGAFVGVPVAGALVGRLGTRRVLPAALAVLGGALAAVPFTAGHARLVVTMTGFGLANSFVDVAMNTQGAHVERVFGQPILSGLHAAFSAGMLAAAGAGALLAWAEVSIAVHFPIVAALPIVLAVRLRPATSDEPRRSRRARVPGAAVPARTIMFSGLIAFCMVFVDDVANAWSAVYVRVVADGGPALAAATFALYSAGMLVGRLTADRFVANRGPIATLRVGAALAGAGAALVVAFPNLVGATVGFVLVGAGLAPVLPVLYSLLGNENAESAASTIAAVTTVGYLGSVAGPPFVGALAELVGLRTAFLVLPALALVIGVAALPLDRHRGAAPVARGLARRGATPHGEVA